VIDTENLIQMWCNVCGFIGFVIAIVIFLILLVILVGGISAFIGNIIKGIKSNDIKGKFILEGTTLVLKRKGKVVKIIHEVELW